MRLRWLASLVMLCLSFGAAYAQEFPKLTGYVVDAANIIPDAEEAGLTAKLKALQDSTGRQVVVATIPDMQGYDLADYGYRLGRAWGIGDQKANNGVVMFLAPNEPAGKRGPRIEVGYGLESVLTDALSSVIAYGIMTPLLREGNISGALNAGVDQIAQQLKLPPEEAAKRAQAVASEQKSGEAGGQVVFWLFIFFFFILPTIWPIFFGRGRRGRRFGSGPVIIWGGGNDWGGGGSSWGSGGGFGGGGGFSGGGGSFGGGGASGGW